MQPIELKSLLEKYPELRGMMLNLQVEASIALQKLMQKQKDHEDAGLTTIDEDHFDRGHLFGRFAILSELLTGIDLDSSDNKTPSCE